MYYILVILGGRKFACEVGVKIVVLRGKHKGHHGAVLDHQYKLHAISWLYTVRLDNGKTRTFTVLATVPHRAKYALPSDLYPSFIPACVK
jgi:hypothetical protein